MHDGFKYARIAPARPLLPLDYVEHLHVHYVSPDTNVLDVRSLDIACDVGPDGRLKWQGRPGNIALDSQGQVAIEFKTNVMRRAYHVSEPEAYIAIRQGE